MAVRRDAARLSRAAHGTPPPATAPEQDTGDLNPDGAADRPARLAAFARARPGDDPPTEHLRRALRDPRFMAGHITATTLTRTAQAHDVELMLAPMSLTVALNVGAGAFGLSYLSEVPPPFV